jgi:hypothetical protein
MARRSPLSVATVCLSLALSSCGGGARTGHAPRLATGTTATSSRQPVPASSATTTSRPRTRAASRSRRPRTAAPLRPRPPRTRAALKPLAKPTELAPFQGSAGSGAGVWRAAGRRVAGVPAVYETTLVPPGGSLPAGIAWMDTRLLAGRLYSGSKSPGGGPYRYTAPIQLASARSLVAAFNGGFMMSAAEGGYYTEHRMIDPLRPGAATLIIYADGSVDVGAWGGDLRMTPRVVAVRQNLVPLVAGVGYHLRRGLVRLHRARRRAPVALRCRRDLGRRAHLRPGTRA